jgi:hypothetical protein
MLAVRVRMLTHRLHHAEQQRSRGRVEPSGQHHGLSAQRIFVASVGRAPLALESGKVGRGCGVPSDHSDTYVREQMIKAEPSESSFSLRRGECLQPVPYGILDAMGSPSLTSDANSDASSAARDGVSAFIARVLDQLALSAWLPAAFLTASVAVLLEFRSEKSTSILRAVGLLTANPLQVLVIMIPLLVIATVITQAFSFEAIRILEGYWHGRGVISLTRGLMIRRHVRRKKAIIERRLKESEQALRAAIPDMIMSGVPQPIVQAIQADLSGKEPPRLTGKQVALLENTNWRGWCDAWRLARVDYLINEENCYPATYRILPTKLGNLLRATEDELRHAGDDLQGFVYRRRDTVSRRLQTQHDQFRTRLEMYCTLVFASVFLLALTPIVLAGRVVVGDLMVTSAVFAAMGAAFYLAAIASAGGYCTALRQMDAASQTPSTAVAIR